MVLIVIHAFICGLFNNSTVNNFIDMHEPGKFYLMEAFSGFLG